MLLQKRDCTSGRLNKPHLRVFGLSSQVPVLLWVLNEIVQLWPVPLVFPVRLIVSPARWVTPHPLRLVPLSCPHAVPHDLLQVHVDEVSTRVLPEHGLLPHGVVGVLQQGKQAGSLGAEQGAV